MAAYVWTGAAENGDIEDPANFEPEGVPGAGDTVTIYISYSTDPSSGTSEAAWTFGEGVGIGGGTYNGPVVLEDPVSYVVPDAVFNGPIRLNAGVDNGTYNGDVILDGFGIFYGGIINGNVDGGYGYIGGGIFNGDVTIPAEQLFTAGDGPVFNGRLRFSPTGAWVHGPLSPDLAAPEDVRLGVTNLGVPGTLEVTAGYPSGVSSDAGLHGGESIVPLGVTSDVGLHGE
jgi:hypothetical protein